MCVTKTEEKRIEVRTVSTKREKKIKIEIVSTNYTFTVAFSFPCFVANSVVIFWRRRQFTYRVDVYISQYILLILVCMLVRIPATLNKGHCIFSTICFLLSPSLRLNKTCSVDRQELVDKTSRLIFLIYFFTCYLLLSRLPAR